MQGIYTCTTHKGGLRLRSRIKAHHHHQNNIFTKCINVKPSKYIQNVFGKGIFYFYFNLYYWKITTVSNRLKSFPTKVNIYLFAVLVVCFFPTSSIKSVDFNSPFSALFIWIEFFFDSGHSKSTTFLQIHF